jgi:hypothetical protein
MKNYLKKSFFKLFQNIFSRLTDNTVNISSVKVKTSITVYRVYQIKWVNNNMQQLYRWYTMYIWITTSKIWLASECHCCFNLKPIVNGVPAKLIYNSWQATRLFKSASLKLKPMFNFQSFLKRHLISMAEISKTILTDFNILNVIENIMEWRRYKNYKSKFQQEHAQLVNLIDKLDDFHKKTGMSDVMYC